MPEISLFGWFHTLVGGGAIIAGVITLAKRGLIDSHHMAGKIYLLSTLLAALSALAIYRHGGFGVAHGLAVLTLLALVVGWVAEHKSPLGKLSPYLQAMCYSATLLFHMIPAITDGLMRLPTHDPVVTRIDDPLLRGFYLAFLGLYVVGFTAQVMLLRRSNSAQAI
ncbi:hypothetical protein LJ739_10830 [Aestuariibacter halophilus]|uniref:DUF2306 domain-containing protein n=1 Tax=Fluctibacter halophilus TaxID=226011 RepID=A0ABS8G982_9ALTE|nr:hypothetical protein [Aestuariibacter halophilus]MCC2616736.1 hypothetical protein [Aestuariibacter halophilus]